MTPMANALCTHEVPKVEAEGQAISLTYRTVAKVAKMPHPPGQNTVEDIKALRCQLFDVCFGFEAAPPPAAPAEAEETGDEPADSHAECGAKRDNDGAADEALEPLRKRSHQTVVPSYRQTTLSEWESKPGGETLQLPYIPRMASAKYSQLPLLTQCSRSSHEAYTAEMVHGRLRPRLWR